jgi:hypothetical protein
MAVVFAVAASIGVAVTPAYLVEPKTLTSGWTESDPNACVGQSFVANVDTVCYVEWFVGEPNASGLYVFDVPDQTTNQLIARGQKAMPERGWRWVCWRDGTGRGGIRVKLPVRTNSLAAESLAYTGTPPTFSPKVNEDGWLSIDLNSRPVFISERTAPQRPDLRVDSVRFVQASSIVRAWVTNHGTRATPVRSGSRKPYATWAMLTANGESLAQQARMTSIAVNQQVVFEFRLGQTQSPDNVLLSVTVNPTQTYVELGTDDNTGYALVTKY